MATPSKPPLIRDRKPRLAVHKFSSCDGCQLALLNAGEDLLALADRVDIVHFVEAGVVDEEADADISLVEGSISTPDERERIKGIRERSRWLIPIGACATSGGPQALRNDADSQAWISAVYEQPQHISALPTATAIAEHVAVDLELPGCPVNTGQVLAALSSLMSGASPIDENDKVCLECKRRGQVCVLVAKGEPCLGPVTVTGCGALCPSLGRDCYGCYGPAETPNVASLTHWLAARGMTPGALARRFLYQQSGAPAFREAARHWQERSRDDRAD
jgi:coenzyme F420-reducing hydrogenase gamma subunit